jgi:hypothetical protein
VSSPAVPIHERSHLFLTIKHISCRYPSSRPPVSNRINHSYHSTTISNRLPIHSYHQQVLFPTSPLNDHMNRSHQFQPVSSTKFLPPLSATTRKTKETRIGTSFGTNDRGQLLSETMLRQLPLFTCIQVPPTRKDQEII